jgi:hypothetical protein
MPGAGMRAAILVGGGLSRNAFWLDPFPVMPIRKTKTLTGNGSCLAITPVRNTKKPTR